MSNDLNGAHILITRPTHQAENLCQLIEQQGGIPVRYPTLQIVGLDHPVICPAELNSKATLLFDKPANFQWLIFTSTNAVNFALKANGGKIGHFGTAQIAAIGQATAKALENNGISVDLLPETGFDSEALLSTAQMQQINNQSVLIVRGQAGRDELAKILCSRAAKVHYWEVYQRVLPETNNAQVIDLLENGKLTAIISTSCESLQNLVTMLGVDYAKKLLPITLIVISERIRETAKKMGFMRVAIATKPSDQAILTAVAAAIKK